MLQTESDPSAERNSSSARPQRPGPAGVPGREPPESGAWCVGAGVGDGRGPTKGGGGPGPPTLHSESGRPRRSAGRRGQCGPGPPPRAGRTRPEPGARRAGSGLDRGAGAPGSRGIGTGRRRGCVGTKSKLPGGRRKDEGAPRGVGGIPCPKSHLWAGRGGALLLARTLPYQPGPLCLDPQTGSRTRCLPWLHSPNQAW